MFTRRLRTVLFAAPLSACLAVSLAACGSDDAGRKADGTKLVAKMRSALNGITSAKLKITTTVGDQQIDGTGAETLRNGKLVAFDLTQNLPGGAGEQNIVIVGGRTYLKQNGVSTDPARPYVLVTANSSNSTVRQLADSLQSAQSSASLRTSLSIVSAAKSVTDEGSADVSGTRARHYRIVVDPSSLPSGVSNSDALERAGISELPVDVYLDGRGRVLRTVTEVSVQDQKVRSEFEITEYNTPVTITAPPASQVSTD